MNNEYTAHQLVDVFLKYIGIDSEAEHHPFHTNEPAVIPFPIQNEITAGLYLCTLFNVCPIYSVMRIFSPSADWKSTNSQLPYFFLMRRSSSQIAYIASGLIVVFLFRHIPSLTTGLLRQMFVGSVMENLCSFSSICIFIRLPLQLYLHRRFPSQRFCQLFLSQPWLRFGSNPYFSQRRSY